MKHHYFLAGAVFALLAGAAQAESAAKYAADMPENVLTPDSVDTDTLGTLEFFDGMPKPETVSTIYDNLDLIRSTTAFLDGMKIASLRGCLWGTPTKASRPMMLSSTRD